MFRNHPLATLSWILALAACGTPSSSGRDGGPDAGPGRDGGPVIDGGDAGPNTDGGPTTDGGQPDSGTPDAGPGDAGPNTDGGSEVVVGSQIPVVSAPSLLATGDLNGDGHPDVVLLYGVPQGGGHTAQLFLGDGNGGLSAVAPLLDTAATPRGVAVADLNGDGLADVAIGACADDGSNAQLALFVGNGKGGFAKPATTVLTVCPFGLATADIDGDGHLDLITAGPGPFVTATSGEVNVYRGGGANLVLLKTLVENSPALGVAAVDLSGDGHPDLAITLANSALDLEQGDGQGDFASSMLTLSDGPFRVVAAGDVDGDGRPDLALGSPHAFSVALLVNQSAGFGKGGGSIAFAPAVYAGASDPVAVLLTDLGGLGRATLVVSNANSYFDGVTLLTPDATGALTGSAIFANGAGYGLGAADFNGDGRTDLVVSDENGKALTVLLNQRPTPLTTDGGVFRTAAHTPVPQVPNNGGPVIQHVDLINITYANDGQASEDEAFGSWIVTSQWLSTIGAEYGVGLGTSQGIHLPDDAPTAVNDGDIPVMIANLIADGGLPTLDLVDGGVANQLYAVYYPRGTAISGQIGNSCQNYGGYHEEGQTLDGQPFAYAVIPTCGGNIASTEITVSHELAEAATDPLVMSAPTYTQGNNVTNGFVGEVGDLCTFFDRRDGQYFVQRIWSNAAAMAGTQPCIPAPADEPYVQVSPSPSSVLSIAAGTTQTVTLTAWSSALTGPFAVGASPSSIGLLQNQFTPTATLDKGLMINGDTAQLIIGVPARTPSRAYASVTVFSGLADDNFAYWPILVTVP